MISTRPPPPRPSAQKAAAARRRPGSVESLLSRRRSLIFWAPSLPNVSALSTAAFPCAARFSGARHGALHPSLLPAEAFASCWRFWFRRQPAASAEREVSLEGSPVSQRCCVG